MLFVLSQPYDCGTGSETCMGFKSLTRATQSRNRPGSVHRLNKIPVGVKAPKLAKLWPAPSIALHFRFAGTVAEPPPTVKHAVLWTGFPG